MELLNKSAIEEVAKNLDLEVPVNQAVEEIQKFIGETQMEKLQGKDWNERRNLVNYPSFWRNLVTESAKRAGVT